MTTLTKTKIEWCSHTWNPVWGCRNGCSFCYARKIANRFWKRIFKNEMLDFARKHPTWAWTPDHLAGLKYFNPTWLESNFNKQFPKKPATIFVNSMSDITYWESEWMEKVIQKIKQYPQHAFFFLTKRPSVYEKINLKNCWLGITLLDQLWIDSWICSLEDVNYHINKKIFISIEPFIGKINLDKKEYGGILKYLDWVIIGAMTGNMKDKIIPKIEWIENIRQYCQDNNIPYFEKNNLQKIVDRDLIQQFPEELKLLNL
ncbi:MAG: DUF5131 family protein [Bacteroidales bacterium]|nr:DUF5131 family protein [Bacteroidales bacterium]